LPASSVPWWRRRQGALKESSHGPPVKQWRMPHDADEDLLKRSQSLLNNVLVVFRKKSEESWVGTHKEPSTRVCSAQGD
jgi:hypothetical protein